MGNGKWEKERERENLSMKQSKLALINELVDAKVLYRELAVRISQLETELNLQDMREPVTNQSNNNGKGKRQLSAAAHKAISDAQKARWAKTRGEVPEVKLKKDGTPAKRNGGVWTPERRKKQAAQLKKNMKTFRQAKAAGAGAGE